MPVRTVLYVSCMADSVQAWHPPVPSVTEVLHATFEHHAYPAHTHDDWTVLLIDEGAVAYTLDRAAHHAVPGSISLLPPHVPHDGRSADRGRAFRKRVLYLEQDWLPESAVETAASTPTMADPRGLSLVRGLHAIVADPAEALAAEHALIALRQLVLEHLGRPVLTIRDAPLARRLRELLDDSFPVGLTLRDAARMLHAHPDHLVRAFSQAYGIPPHRYVTGRRVDRARHLLQQGHSAADVAARVGFHDQPHMTRHFRRVLGATPGAFAA